MGRWSLLLGLVVLTGCASPSKPTPMPKEDYVKHAGVLYGLRQCVRQGDISPELGALGLRYAQSNIDTYWHSPEALNNAVGDYEKAGIVITPENCNEAATIIAGQKQQIDIHNAQVDQNRQDLQNSINQINNNQPIICNTVGSTTMCQ
ncbi:hypothetical protein [Vreelandella venusta]|uniref:hypothetical protein n=1 Tax=Vreelandella venusta TaxID=44935 RepID=UPI00116BEC18|nr:hypothetical protein [Halomonas venusta]GEK52359.1 hypothetical protein HVE01_30800 [Halomonas venusta]